MKKRFLSILLVATLVFSLVSTTAFAADYDYGSLPIYLGISDVDYMAEVILEDIPTKGKSAVEQIRAVYNWVVGVRTKQIELPQFDEISVTEKANSTFYRQTTSAVNRGRLVFRAEYDGSPLSPDSSQYIALFAKKLLFEQNDDCPHYTSLLALLLSHLGYDCRVISGTGTDSGHKWNYVLVDDQYYWLDVCGTDYLTDTEVWTEDHQWDNGYTAWLAANATVIAEQYAYNAAYASGEPWHRCSGWAESYMQHAYQLHLIPERLQYRDLSVNITRADFAAVALALYESLTDSSAPEYAGEAPFTDTDDPVILKAYSLGIVKGIGNNRYAPNDVLTREQAMTMLGRVYELITCGVVNDGAGLVQSDLQSFTDGNTTSGFAKAYVSFFVATGVVNGVGNNKLAPLDYMTIESALKMTTEIAYDCLAVEE